jgi:hypothetical protein
MQDVAVKGLKRQAKATIIILRLSEKLLQRCLKPGKAAQHCGGQCIVTQYAAAPLGLVAQ